MILKPTVVNFTCGLRTFENYKTKEIVLNLRTGRILTPYPINPGNVGSAVNRAKSFMGPLNHASRAYPRGVQSYPQSPGVGAGFFSPTKQEPHLVSPV